MTQSATVKRYFMRATRIAEMRDGEKCDCDTPCQCVVYATDYDALAAQCEALQAQLSACQARVEKAEKDARRYRWLRDTPDFWDGPFVYDDDDGNTWLTGEALDRRVDAALAALGADGGGTKT